MKTSINNGSNTAQLNVDYIMTFKSYGLITATKLINKTEELFRNCKSVNQMYVVAEHSKEYEEFIHAHILAEVTNQKDFLEEANVHLKAKRVTVSMNKVLLKTINMYSSVGFSDIFRMVETTEIRGKNSHLFIQKIQEKMNCSYYVNKFNDQNLSWNYFNSKMRILSY